VSKTPASPRGPRSGLPAAGAVALAAVALVAAGARARPQTPPATDLARNAMHIVAIDPGHGGDDDGVHGVAGTKEKDVVLQIAHRLKTAIETRLQLRVVLTRDGDVNVPLDSRDALANTSRADLFLSLHCNASVRPALRGTEVVTLSPQDYQPPPGPGGKPQPAPPPTLVAPVGGGAPRSISPVPWNLAQLAYADKSSAFGATLVRRLTERALPSNTPLRTDAPARVLVGANMPAVLIELGFLTNADEETALNGPEMPDALVGAIVDAIGDVRFGFPAGGTAHRP